MAEIQLKIAMGANPLSGLPGNVAIEQEINRRAAGKCASSLIYIDLDNFKIYNDVYGFDNGDRVILFTAQTVREAVRQHGSPSDFVGHVGGDDFVIIAQADRVQPLCDSIIEAFEKKVPEFYNPADRKKKCVIARGRDGIEREFPLVSVSIGAIFCEFKSPFSMDELSRKVADIKKYAKSIPGNSFVKDRRSPLS